MENNSEKREIIDIEYQGGKWDIGLHLHQILSLNQRS